MNESVNDLKERNALICSNVHDEPTLLPTIRAYSSKLICKNWNQIFNLSLKKEDKRDIYDSEFLQQNFQINSVNEGTFLNDKI